MARKKIMLDDLKGWAHEQVAEKLRLQCAGGIPKAGNVQAYVSAPDGTKVAIRTARREPNKTEDEYNRRYLGGLGKYESVSLRLPGGSRYTPDWQSVAADGRVTFHEVKGSYRFGSHGRAATAFRECAAAFPEFNFVWAVRSADGSWMLKKTSGGQDAMP
jgi:methionine-rich copper-binding protein CopC